MIKTINARDIGWSVIDTDYSPDQRFLIYSSWSRYGTYPVPRSAGHAHPHVAARVAHPPPPPLDAPSAPVQRLPDRGHGAAPPARLSVRAGAVGIGGCGSPTNACAGMVRPAAGPRTSTAAASASSRSSFQAIRRRSLAGAPTAPSLCTTWSARRASSRYAQAGAHAFAGAPALATNAGPHCPTHTRAHTRLGRSTVTTTTSTRSPGPTTRPTSCTSGDRKCPWGKGLGFPSPGC